MNHVLTAIALSAVLVQSTGGAQTPGGAQPSGGGQAGRGAQAAPGSVRVWKATEIADRGKALAQKLDAQKVASEVVLREGNRTFMMAHREGSGIAEWHEKEADIMVISVGEVTMIYGGTIVDGKTTAPGEMRGPSIKGGTEVRLRAGDVLHIPAQVPHQMTLDPGMKMTYFVAKVVQ
ncbi:MAG: hypothetical protein M3Q85_00850 [Acidobacteriota bacterium]|nr:hypothetical protein [Acidobacteriota bacterium]